MMDEEGYVGEYEEEYENYESEAYEGEEVPEYEFVEE